jgi:hypothetical protein
VVVVAADLEGRVSPPLTLGTETAAFKPGIARTKGGFVASYMYYGDTNAHNPVDVAFLRCREHPFLSAPTRIATGTGT